jgi:hypothetical protein
MTYAKEKYLFVSFSNYAMCFYIKNNNQIVYRIVLSDFIFDYLWRNEKRNQKWRFCLTIARILTVFVCYFRTQLGIIAVRGDTYSSDIAVDDLSISPGACQEVDVSSGYGEGKMYFISHLGEN